MVRNDQPERAFIVSMKREMRWNNSLRCGPGNYTANNAPDQTERHALSGLLKYDR
jgi:hypothetical protein